MTVTAPRHALDRASTPAPVPSWRRLDPVDRFWSGVVYVRALLDLDLAPYAAVREAVGALAAVSPELGRWVRYDEARWRPVGDGERESWLDQVVVASDETVRDPQHAFDVNAAPLRLVPFRLVVGADWVSVRMNHAVGDGQTVNGVLGHILRVAAGGDVRPLPWTVVDPRRRDRVIAGDVARNLGTVVSALRHRRDLAGGTYEPSSVRADAMASVSLALVSDSAFTRELRRLRDERFPGASASGVAMVGVRSAFAAHLPRPRSGFECLFNTRAASAGTQQAWGNWSSGVYIRPADDASPLATTREMSRVRASGLPALAHASLRARSRAATSDTVQVVAPEGSPRLTLSFSPEPATAGVFPGLRKDRTCLATLTRPNGVETITVEGVELAGRLSLGLSFYPDVWAREAVEAAAREFLDDPAGCLASERLRALSVP